MRRLAALALLGLAGCSPGTSLQIDVSLASDVPALSSISVRMFGTREIGTARSIKLPKNARSGQILITDINSQLSEFRVLLTGLSADQSVAAQGVVSVRPIAGHEVKVSALLSSGTLPDSDGDGVPDAIDDCPNTPDPAQDPSCSNPNGDLAGSDASLSDGSATPFDLSGDLSGDLSRGNLSQSDLSGPVYAVGGTVSGLSGTLVLRDNGGDDLTLGADGPFQFATRLHSSATYAVTVSTQPANLLCTVAHGGGSIAGADITDVAVTCTPGHTVGGTVSGITGGTLVLDDNGGDALSIPSTATTFTFATPIAEGQNYAVTIASLPAGHTCTLSADSGTVSTTAVSNVSVVCRLLSVALNEVYARVGTGALGDTNGDGVRDSTADEFVEILNNESFAVDLGGWAILTGTTTPAIRFTFPGGTSLAAKGRAVIFGGGTPTGGFGGSSTFAIGGGTGLSLTDAPANFNVSLVAAVGIPVDSYSYDAATFGSSCTTNCASQVRNPEGTGAFVAHTAAAGMAGILWSPGVAATAAIPKADPGFAVPAPHATNVSVVAYLTPQFNTLMTASDFDNSHLKLFGSSCAAMTNEVTSFTSIGPGSDTSSARMITSAPLTFSTTYCVSVAGTLHSVLGVLLDAPASWELTTRAAASSPASTVVISGVGGCRLESGTAAPTACGGNSSNDEFVELFNPTAAAVDISNWIIQRRTAGGSAACSATIPASTMIQSGHYYLLVGGGYTKSSYAGTPMWDQQVAGSLIAGGSETVALIGSAGSCGGSSAIIDAVSFGTISETLASLQLPALSSISDGTSVERKACYDSTADSSLTGLLPGGGEELMGSGERIGGNNADWIVRPSPGPRSSATAATGTCAH